MGLVSVCPTRIKSKGDYLAARYLPGLFIAASIISASGTPISLRTWHESLSVTPLLAKMSFLTVECIPLTSFTESDTRIILSGRFLLNISSSVAGWNKPLKNQRILPRLVKKSLNANLITAP